MEQQSQKREIEDSVGQILDGPIMCANSCGFFGSVSTNNFCSKCYRDYFLKQSKSISVEKTVAEVVVVEATTSEDPMKQQPTNRCSFCRKRVGLTGFKCRCGYTFCDVHRYTDKHNCSFDYKSAAQDAIAEANPVVKADKIEKI